MKKLLTVSMLCYFPLANAIVEIDKNQNDEIAKLKKLVKSQSQSQPQVDVSRLTKRIRSLEKKIENFKPQAISMEKSEHPEIANLNKKIYMEEEKLKKMEKAIKLGADKSILQAPMKEVLSNIANLESEKKDLENSSMDGAGREVASVSDLFQIEGVLEVDMTQSESTAGVVSNDIEIATFELGIDSTINEHFSAHVLFEKQDSPSFQIEIAEGSITSSYKEFGVDVTMGKLVVPFGRFDTNFFEDTMGLSLSEAKENALLVTYGKNGLSTSGYFYNPTTVKSGEDERFRSYGFDVSYAMEQEDWSVDFGVSYISDFLDSDTLEGASKSTPTLVRRTSGSSLHFNGNYKNVSLITEYIFSLGDIHKDDFSWTEGSTTNAAEISTMQVEVGYNFSIWGKESVASFGFQKSSEAIAASLLEKRYSLGLSTNINEQSMVGAEIQREEDYKTTECSVTSATTCGSGSDSTKLTLRFAVAF
jgi:hypothetical protein